MRYGSVCSGIEAATVAWHALGWTPAFFSEIEPYPCALLAHHYPDVPNFGDMTKFQEWPSAAIDVLVGGTPCQAYSVAGLRRGLADPRGNLTLTYLAIAERYRPEWVVWENVPGVLSDRTGAFGTFLGGLAELGYGWAYRVLDAQYFGLAQRRKRVFVVGSARGWARAAAVLSLGEGLRGHPAPRRRAGETVANSLVERPDRGGGNSEGQRLIAHYGGGQTVRTHTAAEVSLCLTAKTQQRIDAETETFVVTMDVAGALAAEPGAKQQTYTMQAMQVRRLTPRECERLQGFPDDYTAIPYRGKPAADGPRYRALGNSMAVPVMRWIGARIAMIRDADPT